MDDQINGGRKGEQGKRTDREAFPFPFPFPFLFFYFAFAIDSPLGKVKVVKLNLTFRAERLINKQVLNKLILMTFY